MHERSFRVPHRRNRFRRRRPCSKLELVDAASVVPTGVGAIAPPALVANRGTDQVTPDHLTQHQVDVETHLEAAPAASDPVAAYVPPDPPFPIAEAGDDGRGWTANWLGMLLMALGIVSVLSSSRVVRGALQSHSRSVFASPKGS